MSFASVWVILLGLTVSRAILLLLIIAADNLDAGSRMQTVLHTSKCAIMLLSEHMPECYRISLSRSPGWHDLTFVGRVNLMVACRILLASLMFWWAADIRGSCRRWMC